MSNKSVLKIDGGTLTDKLEGLRNKLHELIERYPFIEIDWDGKKLKEY